MKEVRSNEEGILEGRTLTPTVMFMYDEEGDEAVEEVRDLRRAGRGGGETSGNIVVNEF